jgi:general secretion pathway protein D
LPFLGGGPHRARLRGAFFAMVAWCVLLLPTVGSAQDFTINLKETDIQELIKFVAEATGTTIVVDPSVKGKVKVVSSRPVNRELYDLFLAILDVHGYTAVSSGGVSGSSRTRMHAPRPCRWRTPSGQAHSTIEYVTQVICASTIFPRPS